MRLTYTVVIALSWLSVVAGLGHMHALAATEGRLLRLVFGIGTLLCLGSAGLLTSLLIR